MNQYQVYSNCAVSPRHNAGGGTSVPLNFERSFCSIYFGPPYVNSLRAEVHLVKYHSTCHHGEVATWNSGLVHRLYNYIGPPSAMIIFYSVRRLQVFMQATISQQTKLIDYLRCTSSPPAKSKFRLKKVWCFIAADQSWRGQSQTSTTTALYMYYSTEDLSITDNMITLCRFCSRAHN